MSYNDVFLCIKDFWWNFIFETLDNKKNNQKMDQRILKKIEKFQFFEENQCRTICIFVYQGFLMKFHFWNFGQ